MISESGPSLPEKFIEFPYSVSKLLDDFVAVSDFQFMLLLPSGVPAELKQNLIAAAKAHSLGLRSIDYVLKRYGPWQVGEDESQSESHTKNMLDKSVEEVGEIIERFTSVENKPGVLGLVAAGGALHRLHSSFRAASLMIRLGYVFESFVILRLILEQAAWAYAVHEIDDEDAFRKVSSTKAVTKLKRFLPYVGPVYGLLSDYAHIAPYVTSEYIEAHEDDYRVILTSPKHNLLLSYISLRLADTFGVVAEYVYRGSVPVGNYLEEGTGEYSIKRHRPLTADLEDYSAIL